MYSGRRQSRAKRGFLLVALVIALTLFAFMAPPMLAALSTVSGRVALYLDYRTAASRSARAAALLKAPVFYCGYGMPSDAQEYKKAFDSQITEPFSWNGPISIASCGSPNDELRVAYARPGSVRTSCAFLSDGPTGVVTFSKRPDANEVASASSFSKPKSVKNWIVFGSAVPLSVPLSITKIEDKSLTVKSYSAENFSIPQGERMYLFRAMKIFCRNGCLYAADYRTSGEQPRVDGVCDMRFDVDPRKKELTVYILVKGNATYDSPRDIIGKESWPDDYLRPWLENLPRYQLYASRRTWRLPNCAGENTLNGSQTRVLSSL